MFYASIAATIVPDRQGNHLQRVDEVRSVVTSDPDLICRLAGVHVVPGTAPSLRILAPQRSVHEDCAAKQEHRHVGQDCGVASVVSRLLSLEEDV